MADKEYIERGLALSDLDNGWFPQSMEYTEAVAIARDIIKSSPAADVVEVRHGEWVHCDGKSNLWYCSECGDKILYNPTRRTYNIRKRPVNEVNKYCRCCGAKMDGKGEQE